MTSASKWERIRRHYEAAHSAIVAAGPAEWGMDPYAWREAGICLTPIEYGLWCDIRIDRLVLYPQYPVGRRFVDFGNPAARVAIECDGRAFHVDKQRDDARQAEIEALGWTVYRFTGSACMRDTREVEDEDTGRVSVALAEHRLQLRELGQQHGIVRGGVR